MMYHQPLPFSIAMIYWIVFLRELLKYLYLKVFCMEWLFWVLKFPIISWKPCNSAKARQSRFTLWFSIPVVSRASCTLLQITLCLWWLTNCRRKPSWFLMASSTFELLLVRLDIQQESDRHTDVLDAITKHLGIGSYREWSEEHTQEWLLINCAQWQTPSFWTWSSQNWRNCWRTWHLSCHCRTSSRQCWCLYNPNGHKPFWCTCCWAVIVWVSCLTTT